MLALALSAQMSEDTKALNGSPPQGIPGQRNILMSVATQTDTVIPIGQCPIQK
jgi:hypothetical protein